MSNRTQELQLIDSIERQLMKLSETCCHVNMVRSLIEQVNFLGQQYFFKEGERHIDTAHYREVAARIIFYLEAGKKISSFDIGEEIYPYIRRFRDNGMKNIKSEKKYVSKAKQTFTYYYIDKNQ